MGDHRDSELHELRSRITSAEYRVDPGAVADAIVRRRWSVDIALEPAQPSSIASRQRTRARVRFVVRAGTRTRTQALAA
jgi:hypothetical protein